MNMGLIEQRQNNSPYLAIEKDDWLERLTLFYSAYLIYARTEKGNGYFVS